MSNVRDLETYRNEHNIVPPELVKEQILHLVSGLSRYGFGPQSTTCAAELFTPMFTNPLQERRFRKEVDREVEAGHLQVIGDAIVEVHEERVLDRTLEDITYLWGVSKCAMEKVLSAQRGPIVKDGGLFYDNWYVSLIGFLEMVYPEKREALSAKAFGLGLGNPNFSRMIEPARHVHGIVGHELEETLRRDLGSGFMESMEISEQARRLLRFKLIKQLEGHIGPLTQNLANNFARALPFTDLRLIQTYTRECYTTSKQ